jgi:RHS repeat-associated protein
VIHPGQYYDVETGLHYNWHRFYDPETGRYISADPIGLAGGMNLYAYVGADPVNWVDFNGLKVERCKRPAQILDGRVDHYWLKTDTKEMGMGEAEGGGIPGREKPSQLYPETAIRDHSGESTKPGSSCEEMKCIDETCVNNELILGKRLGRWSPGSNDCQQFTSWTLSKCRKKTEECCAKGMGGE